MASGTAGGTKPNPPQQPEQQAGGADGGDRYDMSRMKRGLCLIINNLHSDPYISEGSKSDANKMEKLFKDTLGFEVVVRNDKTANDMKKMVSKVADSIYYSKQDCFAMVIMSHGADGGMLKCGKDDRGHETMITAEDIFHTIQNCEHLVGKPKLFIILACRGKRVDYGAEIRPVGDDSITTRRIPRGADCFYAYATPPGYVAITYEQKGSPFIDAISEVFTLYGTSMEIMKMMTRVNRRVADIEHSGDKKQVPYIATTMTKDLYFPKISSANERQWSILFENLKF